MKRINIKLLDGRKCELEFEYDIGDYITRPEACLIAQVSDTQLRRLINNGQFPNPVEMSDDSHGFLVDDVLNWRKLE